MSQGYSSVNLHLFRFDPFQPDPSITPKSRLDSPKSWGYLLGFRVPLLCMRSWDTIVCNLKVLVYEVLRMNEWVLIATCKQLVWSNRIGRNMPIWVLLIVWNSGWDEDVTHLSLFQKSNHRSSTKNVLKGWSSEVRNQRPRDIGATVWTVTQLSYSTLWLSSWLIFWSKETEVSWDIGPTTWTVT
jgi:hypothetical protein